MATFSKSNRKPSPFCGSHSPSVKMHRTSTHITDHPPLSQKGCVRDKSLPVFVRVTHVCNTVSAIYHTSLAHSRARGWRLETSGVRVLLIKCMQMKTKKCAHATIGPHTYTHIHPHNHIYIHLKHPFLIEMCVILTASGIYTQLRKINTQPPTRYPRIHLRVLSV